MKKIKIYEKLTQIAEKKNLWIPTTTQNYTKFRLQWREKVYIEDKCMKEKFKKWGRQVTEVWCLSGIRKNKLKYYFNVFSFIMLPKI